LREGGSGLAVERGELAVDGVGDAEGTAGDLLVAGEEGVRRRGRALKEGGR
jgi:hypothetical protein